MKDRALDKLTDVMIWVAELPIIGDIICTIVAIYWQLTDPDARYWE